MKVKGQRRAQEQELGGESLLNQTHLWCPQVEQQHPALSSSAGDQSQAGVELQDQRGCLRFPTGSSPLQLLLFPPQRIPTVPQLLLDLLVPTLSECEPADGCGSVPEGGTRVEPCSSHNHLVRLRDGVWDGAMGRLISARTGLERFIQTPAEISQARSAAHLRTPGTRRTFPFHSSSRRETFVSSK